MADTTNTTVVQVTVTEEGGYSKTFNLDNPKTNLTLNQIRNAFQPAITGGWLLGNNDKPIIAVERASYLEAIKTLILGEEIIITPSSLSIDPPNNIYGTNTGDITVTGGTIQSVSVVKTSGVGTPDYFDVSVSFTDSVATVTVRSVNENASGFTGTVILVISGKVYEIPVYCGMGNN